MKILFIVSRYYPEGAGSGSSVRAIAEALLKDGHEVIVIRLTDKKEKYTEHQAGVKIYYLPIRNIYFFNKKKVASWKRFFWHFLDIFNPCAAYDVWKILRMEKPDIVNTSVISGFSTSIFYVIKMMRIKLVHTMRDYYLMCPQSGMFNDGKNCEKICAKCRPFYLMRKMASRRVDMFLSNSDFVAARHQKLKTLPADVPCYTQWNMNSNDNIARPRAFPSKNICKFGFIGRLTDSKGIEVLLKALDKLQTHKWKLIVAGDGKEEYVNFLKNKYTNKRIEFVGWSRSDDFYKSIDVLICPSLYYEPLPRVIFEAYSYALPVVASDTGGIPEMIDDGECGFIYFSQDHIELAHYMDMLASDKQLYEDMSKKCVKKAQLFTRENIMKGFYKRINDLLENKA